MTSAADGAVMARALAGLFAAGATLALLTVLLPHSPRLEAVGLLAICANAYMVAGLLLWQAGRASTRALEIALAWGATLITGVAYFSGESPSPLVFFYLWIFLYSSYFFTRIGTVVQIAYVGVVYGALLIERPPEAGVPSWWIVGMGTLVVAAILVVAMRVRVEQLIERLYDAARTDPLTQLLNRRGFRELLDLELERSRRGESRAAIVVGDLDRFKAVNDRGGHPSGDAVLQRVARVLLEGKRQIDTVARVGGEEFALILPDTDEEGALMVAERLRTAMQEQFAGDPVPITVSFGIALHPRHGETASALLRAADEALYGAKDAGRNRTLVHSQALRESVSWRSGERDVETERYVSVVLQLAEAADLRFSGSARHSETVGRYAEMMARELGLAESRVKRVKLGGVLHDIGKVGVADAILRKPGKLDADEWLAIKRHPELGSQILENPALTDVRRWVGAHHERIDGQGYPRGIDGAHIPLEARILAVADAFEAMTADRSYRLSIGTRAAREELERGSGTQFDARVVQALFDVLDRDSVRAAAA